MVVKKLHYEGHDYTVAEMAEYLGITPQCLRKRLQRCETDEDALFFISKKGKHYFNINGCKYSLYELSKRSGLDRAYILRHFDDMTDAEKKELTVIREKPEPELFEYKGGLYTVAELAKIAGVHHRTMNKRLNTYTSIEECIHPTKED